MGLLLPLIALLLLSAAVAVHDLIGRRYRRGVGLSILAAIIIGVALAVLIHWDRTMRRLWNNHPSATQTAATPRTAGTGAAVESFEIGRRYNGA
jgi:hypothetical protein